MTPHRVAFVLAAAASACGGDGAPGIADSGSDAPIDASRPDAPADASPPTDASAGTDADPTGITSNSIPCGADTCNTYQGAVCCVGPPPATPFCTTGPCPAGDDTYGCDGHEDCSGTEQCCVAGQLTGTPTGRSSRCVGDCQYPTRSTICHEDKDCPTNAAVCCFHASGLPAAGDCRPSC